MAAGLRETDLRGNSARPPLMERELEHRTLGASDVPIPQDV